MTADVTIPDDDATPDQPGHEPTETSKPIGDAIPTPVEPGLDQPLPPKSEIPAQDADAPAPSPTHPPATP
ncbi:hypothetical protein [Paraburkholderia sp.]|uniref:hypothetical protein n=1 Tax=Paraburkholderia sp. TaxID=1926495 RepID=UPI0023A6E54C|nr:hypothetical protein [Paraburkholderia sp.]MDE1179281.1 hypothetical protein [Paraburkholderia sp.]